MYIILKAAITVDGFLGAKERLIVSGPEDRQAVLELRDSVDAILVGAGTVRADNPSLLARSKKPIRVVLSRSARLEQNLNLFNDSKVRTLVYHNNDKINNKNDYFYFDSNKLSLEKVIEHLSSIGVKRLLVEGGADVLSQFYSLGLYNELRLSVGGKIWGKAGQSLKLNSRDELKLIETKILGENVVLTYRK